MKYLKNLLLTPWWIIRLFSSAKSFKANPVIGSRKLNRCGLHICRLLLAHGFAYTRRNLFCRYQIPKQYRQEFNENGFIVIKNFLPDDEFNQLRQQAEYCEGTARELSQGDTLTQRILLDADAMKNTPALASFCDNQKYQSLMRFTASTLSPALIYLQRIRNGVRQGNIDPQKTLHSDTFQPHMKSWFYLDDVPIEKGPLHYVRGSHRITKKRLSWEYKRSIQALANPDGYSEKGSFRASSDDLKTMGLPEATAITVPANTLVIASTNGFHGRGHSDPGQSRFEIWAYNRRNPFSPLPGLALKSINQLEKRLLEYYWQKMDIKAAKNNSQSTWHKIDNNLVKFHQPNK